MSPFAVIYIRFPGGALIGDVRYETLSAPGLA